MSAPDEVPPAPRSPVSPRLSLAYDLTLTLALLAGCLVLVGQASYLLALLALLQIAPLAARRTHPTAAFALVAAAMALQLPLADTPGWGQVAMPVAVYSVAAYAPRRAARVALVVALVGGVLGPLDWAWAYAGGSSAPASVLALFLVTELLVVAPWALGSLTRTRQAYVAELVDRGRRLEQEATTRATLAASEERARIAREMHDVVAHGLSVMVVQADGARYAVGKDPDRAAAALETIAATGRESLTEMRRMLGLLRSEDGTRTGGRPQPGLTDLDGLLADSQAAGMRLVAHVDPLPAVAPGIGLTVYRVVQEALTNARKHAGPDAHVEVRVAASPDAVHVRVSDDGRGPVGDEGEGHGLLGMRERVAVHDGSLHAGGRPGGGFEVRATVPLAVPAPASVPAGAGGAR